MKLFVDDIRNTPDKSWKLVRTITDAINAIDIFNFEVISLDHDISHQFSAEGRILLNPDIKSKEPSYLCPETFLPIAIFIKEKYKMQLIAKEVGATMTCTSLKCPERKGKECEDGRIPKIILHTSNPAGALRMKNALKGFEIVIKESVPIYVNR